MSMDGVQRIIEEIEKTTEATVSEMLGEAKKKVDGILQEARVHADEQERSIVDSGEQEARRESQRILAEARIKARREKVKAQEDIVQQSFERAREGLKEAAEQGMIEGTAYRDVLERLIRQSVVSSGESALEVLVNPRDTGLLTREVLASIAGQAGGELGVDVSLSLSEEPLSCMGGVVIRSSDGKIRVDNTFEARIDRFRETIRTRVARELFGQET